MNPLLALPRSRLATTSLRTRHTALVGRPVAASSHFHTSAPRSVLKEESERREGVESEIEAEKQAQLRKQKEGNPHWHESLASSSEAGVKADRDEVPDEDGSKSAMEERVKKGKTKEKGEGGKRA